MWETEEKTGKKHHRQKDFLYHESECLKLPKYLCFPQQYKKTFNPTWKKERKKENPVTFNFFFWNSKNFEIYTEPEATLSGKPNPEKKKKNSLKYQHVKLHHKAVVAHVSWGQYTNESHGVIDLDLRNKSQQQQLMSHQQKCPEDRTEKIQCLGNSVR